MAVLRINSNETFTVDITVRESDKYSESVYVRFDRNMVPEEVRGVSEMFLTPDELDKFGRFLVRQADEIKTAQVMRKESI
jgi:hypothetical protein